MKKVKAILGPLALFVGISTAFAYKTSNALPGNLYYYNSDNSCVVAPCSTVDQTGDRCPYDQLFTDNGCDHGYGGVGYATEFGR